MNRKIIKIITLNVMGKIVCGNGICGINTDEL